MKFTSKHVLGSWRKVQASFMLGVFVAAQLLPGVKITWAQATPKTPLVAILVEDDLLQDGTLKSKIYRYAKDVQQTLDAQSLVVPLPKDTSVKDIYEGLATWYWSGYNFDPDTKLEGVVLVGDLPIPVVDKNDRLWPTIFPYTDFESPAYAWDDTTARFVSRPAPHMQAEIWHGVIRGSSEIDTARREQLRQYFDRNHKVHTGETTFDKKVLHADLTAQKKVIPPDLIARYEAWIDHAEDVQYLRYTKHLAGLLRAGDSLFGEGLNPFAQLSDTEQGRLIDLITSENSSLDTEEVRESIAGNGTADMPDIFTKYLIDQLLSRYQDLYQPWITQINNQIVQSGRWDPTEVDTLPVLVSMRDEASSLYLRKVNDELETRLVDLIGAANLANRPWVEENTEVTYFEDDGFGGQNFFEVTRPNYWNGAARDSNFTVDDCSLYRGSPRDNLYKTSQQVEANRTFDPSTAGSCAAESDSDAAKEADQYEGCCATNLIEQNGIFSYERCDTTSTWNAGEGLASVIHQGAELPVYSMVGTNESTTGAHGAAGCLPVIQTSVDEADSHRFSSLMLHQEPTPATLQAQVAGQTSRALPVDDPRGFSFLDHGLTAQRINFLNLFSLRENTPSSADTLKTQVTNQLAAKVDELNSIVTTANATSEAARAAFQAGCGGTYSQTSFDTFTTRADCDGDVRFFESAQSFDVDDFDITLSTIDFDQLYAGLTWLDKSIDEKNTEALELTMSDSAAWQQAGVDDDFNGYELVQVVANGRADSVELGFVPEGNESDTEFLTAQRTTELAGLDPSGEEDLTYEGYDFEETFLGQAQLDTCDGLSNEVLSWSQKLECQLKNTPIGERLSLFVPELGSVNKTKPAVITDPDKKLADKILRINPSTVLVHNQAVDPVPVSVVVTDEQNQVQTDIGIDAVSLRFSSPSVLEFFSVFPDQTLPLTNGRAEFWLVPKTPGYGGKFALIAEATQGEDRILSAKVPLRVTRHRLQLTSLTPEVTVKDPQGVALSLNVLNADRKLDDAWLGKELEIEVTGGRIQGGNQVTLSDLTTPLLFLPGEKAGSATIRINDPAGELMSDELILELNPAEPVAVSLTSSQRHVVQDAGPVTVTATVTDAYGNTLDNFLHEYSWRVEGGEILGVRDRDENPRKNGLQETISKGTSQIELKPNRNRMRVEVVSDKLPKAGRSFEWDLIDRPQVKVFSQTEAVVAGEDNIELQAILADKKGGRILDDFTGQVQIAHLDQRQAIHFGKGEATTEFDPGTVAGNFVAEVMVPGFAPAQLKYQVLPAAGYRLNFAPKTWQSEYDVNDEIELSLLAQDRFGNQLESGGKVLVKASDPTNDKIVPISEVSLNNGATDVTITPTGETGTLNLIAQKDGWLPATYSLNLVSPLELEDLSALTPKSLLSLWLGFPSGDIFQKNIANTALHAGQTQAVGGLISPPNPGAMKARLSITETTLMPRVSLRLLSDAMPRFHFTNADTTLAEARLNFGRSVDLSLNETRTEAGVYFDGVSRFESKLEVTNNTLFLEETPVLRLNSLGGVTWLNPEIKVFKNDSVTDWEVYLDRQKLGVLYFYAPGVSILPIDDWQPDVAGLQLLKPQKTTLIWEPSATGNHHLSPTAWVLVDQASNERADRRLGSGALSVENADNLGVGWTEAWKPGTLLAAGNSIGESTRIGASDIFILYGDPSLSVDPVNNESNKSGQRLDVGQAVWTAPSGVIDGLVSGSFSTPNVGEVLVESDNRFRLLQPDAQSDDWQDRGEFLTVDEPIQKSLTLRTNLNGTNNETDDLAILDTGGRLRLYDISQGNWRVTQTALDELQWIATGKFNDDDLEDVAFVDKSLNLAVTMRTGSGLGVPIYLDSLAPNFETITESSDDEVVSYLASSFISYQDLETVVPRQDWQTINISSGEARLVDLENLAEDLDTAYREGTPTSLGNQKNFSNLVNDPSLTSAFTLRSTNKQVEVGDTLSARMTLRTDTARVGTEVMLPEDAQLSLDKVSLNCAGCPSKPRFYKTDGFGAAWVYLGSLPARQNITLSWNYTVDEIVLDETVAVLDKDQDGLDDLLVVRGDRLVQYLSRDQEYDAEAVIPALDAPVEIDYRGVPTTISLTDDTDTTATDQLLTALDPLLSDPDLLATEVTSRLAEDTDGDGIPNQFDDYPGAANDQSVSSLVQNLGEQRQDFLCGYGDCFNFPVSQAFMAPGLVTQYLPPIAAPTGTKKKGKPAKSWPSPNQETSKGRLYLMPTTTGHLGVSVCLGSYPTHMTDPAWVPNCSIVTPKIDFMGVCEADDGTESSESILATATQLTSNGSNALAQLNGQNLLESAENFTPQTLFGASTTSRNTAGPNSNIAGIDLVSNWLKGQMAEFTSFSMGLPTLQMNFKNRSIEGRAPATGVGLDALERAQADLSQYPFVRLERQAITLPYPNISGPAIGGFTEQFSGWKDQLQGSSLFDISVPEITQRSTDLTNFGNEISGLVGNLDASRLQGIRSNITGYNEQLERQLDQTRADYNRFCVQGLTPNQTNCQQAQQSILQFGNLRSQLQPWQSALGNLNVAEMQNSLTGFESQIASTTQSLQQLSDLRTGAEGLMTSAGTNLENLQSYQNIPTQLAEIPAQSKQMLSMAADGVQHMDDFWGTYMTSLDDRLGQWDQAYGMIGSSFGAFDSSVLAPLVGFNNGCRTCAIDRGTSLGWLFQILLGSIELPVFQLPQMPDIALDFSNLDLGLDFTVPDNINYQSVDVELFQLPNASSITSLDVSQSIATVADIDLPNVSQLTRQFGQIESQLNLANTLTQNLPSAAQMPRFDASGNFIYNSNLSLPQIPAPNLSPVALNLPTMPTFPNLDVVLPELPNLPAISVPELPLQPPSLTLPQLPTLPDAPQLPLNFISGLQSMVEIPFSFLDLFCTMRLGVTPVPEWYVKPYVEQLTNRSELSFGLDFPKLSLKNFSLGSDTISLGTGLSLGQVFDPVSQLVDSVGNVGETLIDNLSEDRHAGQESPNIPLPVDRNIPQNIPTEWLEIFGWSEDTRARHLASEGKMLSVDEFWEALQDQVAQSRPNSLAQSQLQQKILALEKPTEGSVQLARVVSDQLASKAAEIAAHSDKVEQDLALLDDLLETPWTEWASHPGLQARSRYLATIEEEYESYVPTELESLTEGLNSAATLESDGTVIPALPVTVTNRPAVESTATLTETNAELTTSPAPGLYYVSHLNNKAELFTAYTPKETVKLLLTDHDDNNTPEIWWAERGTLYLKDTEPIPETSSDRKVITVGTKTFVGYYAPGAAPETTHFATTQQLGFDDLGYDVNYWEWVLSDHHEIVEDIQKRSNSRLARSWDRYAYTDREALTENGVVVDHIIGNPTFKIKNGETILPVTAGTRLRTNFSVELGQEDQVELVLPDGSGVSLLASEKFFLEGIRKGERLTNLRRKSPKPGFGILVGIRDNVRSHLLGPFHHPITQP